MIVISLRGRLGNQLFIYAMGRALQKKYGQKLVIVDNVNDTKGVIQRLQLTSDIEYVNLKYGHEYDYYNMKAEDYEHIKISPINGLQREKNLQKQLKRKGFAGMNIVQRWLYYLDKLIARTNSERERFKFEEKFKRIYAKYGILCCENGFIEYPSIKSKNIFLSGYFQSEKYFDNVKEELFKEIVPKVPIRQEIMDFVKKIESTESVCLSIRMGDYLNNPILGVCTHQYYQRAIDIMYKKVPEAVIYVFSDDVEAVKKSFKFKNEVIFEPVGNSEEEKLYYMSKCKYFILSNSSFSWWVQYLSDNKNKIVIAPKKWFKKDIPCDIYQKDWILVDVD